MGKGSVPILRLSKKVNHKKFTMEEVRDAAKKELDEAENPVVSAV